MPLLRFPFNDSSLRSGRGGRIQFVGGAPGQSPAPNAPNRSDGSVLTLIVVLGLGIGIGVLHNKLRVQRRTDVVLAGVRAATYPFQRSGSIAEAGLISGWDVLFRGSALEAENAELRRTIAGLRAENEQLKDKAAEADRLRPAIGLIRAQSAPPTAAAIIALLPAPHFDSITVSRGTRDGIHMQSIARTPDGLVGQVTDTGPMTSEIMLLTDSNSDVSALIRRKGVSLGISGIVEGQGRGRALVIKYLKREDDVRVGDDVVSSGYGGVYPPDIPIGVISAVKSDESALFVKSAVVSPAAGMPGNLREVYLLRP